MSCWRLSAHVSTAALTDGAVLSARRASEGLDSVAAPRGYDAAMRPSSCCLTPSMWPCGSSTASCCQLEACTRSGASTACRCVAALSACNDGAGARDDGPRVGDGFRPVGAVGPGRSAGWGAGVKPCRWGPRGEGRAPRRAMFFDARLRPKARPPS